MKILISLSLLILVSCSLKSSREIKTDLSAIDRLIEGNKRYYNSHQVHPHQSKDRLKEISSGQHPFAVVVSCSDSRVPPEIIFDQGLGDLFVIRTAGNVIGDYELASIEYAVLKLNCKVIIVTGHENCGAIQYFVDQPIDSLPGHLNVLINFIRLEPNAIQILDDDHDKNYRVVIHNVIFGVHLLKESSILRQKFENKELEIYGGVYHMATGKVQIIEDEVKK